MQEERDQHTARLKKLDQLRERGIEAFPSDSGRTHTLEVISAQFDELKDSSVVVSGRIMAVREHGKSAFISLRDGSADLQCFVRQDGVGEDQFEAFSLLDIGDIVEVSGKVFETKRGEKSIDATAVRLLAKALRPLPEKWHGLSDTEKRYRQRYLDILTSPESKSRFLLRSKIVSKLREFLDRHKFIEVETPVLQPIYGGAAARPFTTHYDALDTDMYLRISDELYLKRLIVGGLERVYEIGKDFRNEGIDTDHLQEFSMLEFYWAYTDYDRLMDFTEELLGFVLDSALGSRKVTFQGTELDFSSPLSRVDFYSLFEEKTGISLRGITDPAALRKLLEDKQVPHDTSISTLSGLIDHVYKKTIRPTLVQPVFLVDYPYELVPLAKRKKDDPATIAMFQLVAAGSELVKAYNELNDPIDQRDRMLASQAGKDQGERYPLDEDYLRALEHGMPPTAGFGLGIDRLTMLLSDTPSIRDVVLFPTLKPKEEK